MGARGTTTTRRTSQKRDATEAPATPRKRAQARRAPAGIVDSDAAPTRTRRAATPTVDGLVVAPCAALDTLRTLQPDAARLHVHAYLHDVMSNDDADAFEALSYRWELRLVTLDTLMSVRGIDLDRRTLTRYRAALRRGSAFPPLIGLGGEGSEPAQNALLCDGYHRAAAMLAVGIRFAWIWLAVDVWRAESPAPMQDRIATTCGV